MNDIILRVRLELLIDAPLVARIEAIAERCQIGGWTILPTLSGRGAGDRWSDDQLSGAQAKRLFLSVTSATKADSFTAALRDLLDSHGVVLLRSPVEVVRANKFE